MGSPCHLLNVTSAPAVLVELERSNREHKKGGAGKGEPEQRKGAAAAPVAQVTVARSSWGRVHAALSDSTCARAQSCAGDAGGGRVEGLT